MNDDNGTQASRPSFGDQRNMMKAVTVRELKSEDLLLGAAEILIRHGQDQYRLRSTSKGKLILTK